MAYAVRHDVAVLGTARDGVANRRRRRDARFRFRFRHRRLPARRDGARRSVAGGVGHEAPRGDDGAQTQMRDMSRDLIRDDAFDERMIRSLLNAAGARLRLFASRTDATAFSSRLFWTRRLRRSFSIAVSLALASNPSASRTSAAVGSRASGHCAGASASGDMSTRRDEAHALGSSDSEGREAFGRSDARGRMVRGKRHRDASRATRGSRAARGGRLERREECCFVHVERAGETGDARRRVARGASAGEVEAQPSALPVAFQTFREDLCFENCAVVTNSVAARRARASLKRATWGTLKSASFAASASFAFLMQLSLSCGAKIRDWCSSSLIW